MAPIDRINRVYFREIKRARQFTTLHHFRNELICQARAHRHEACREIGIRVR